MNFETANKIKNGVLVLDNVPYFSVEAIDLLVTNMIDAAFADNSGVLNKQETEQGAAALVGLVSGLSQFEPIFATIGKQVVDKTDVCNVAEGT